MPGHSVKVGQVELVSLTDGYGEGEPNRVFPQSAMAHWREEFPELLDADELIHPRYGSVAVRSRGRLIVVDTGLQAEDGTLLRDMESKGVDRMAVDLVALTHLHPDHVGWNLTDGSPTFPNARYLVPRDDWEFWTRPEEPEEHIREQVLPLQDLNVLDLIEDGYEITNELKAVATPGHTPGHMSFEIGSGGEKGYLLGDVSHTPAQAHYTHWNPLFDMDNILSRETRHAVLDRLEEDGSLVAAGHYPDPGFGKYVRRDGRRAWEPA